MLPKLDSVWLNVRRIFHFLHDVPRAFRERNVMELRKIGTFASFKPLGHILRSVKIIGPRERNYLFSKERGNSLVQKKGLESGTACRPIDNLENVAFFTSEQIMTIGEL